MVKEQYDALLKYKVLGYCHIGKINSSQTAAEAKDFKEIHKIIDSVEEFQHNGIRLFRYNCTISYSAVNIIFSGVVADIMLRAEHQSILQGKCFGSDNWCFFKDNFLTKIKAVTKDTWTEKLKEKLLLGLKENAKKQFHVYDSVCFRSLGASSSKGEKREIEYGQKIIQNEAC